MDGDSMRNLSDPYPNMDAIWLCLFLLKRTLRKKLTGKAGWSRTLTFQTRILGVPESSSRGSKQQSQIIQKANTAAMPMRYPSWTSNKTMVCQKKRGKKSQYRYSIWRKRSFSSDSLKVLTEINVLFASWVAEASTQW